MNIVNNIIKERLIDKNVKHRFYNNLLLHKIKANISYYFLDDGEFLNLKYDIDKFKFIDEEIKTYYFIREILFQMFG
jgi:hypothetical protein